MSHLYQFKTCSCIQYVCIFHQVKKRKKRESKKVLDIINIKNNKYSCLEKVITAYIFKVQSLFIVIKCSDRWMSILPYSLLYRMSNHSHSYVFYFEKLLKWYWWLSICYPYFNKPSQKQWYHIMFKISILFWLLNDL